MITSDIEKLIQLLAKLPGLGPRSARRAALYLVKRRESLLQPLVKALADTAENVGACSECGNLDVHDPCAICSDGRRERSVICVVELPKDVMRIETTGAYKGMYHVLGGHIAPLDGIGPDKLNIDSLLTRARDSVVKEIVLATNPTVEGDGTALHISSLLESTDVNISRLARGLAAGAAIEFATKDTLAEAITGRQPLP